MLKKITAVILIILILLVGITNKHTYAAAPVALAPAAKYAIGAGLVAGGLYAADSESLNYVINDYWNKATSHVKQQWQNVVVYGTGIGIILLNDPLKNSIKEYLNYNYNSGINNVVVEEGVEVTLHGPGVEIPEGTNIQKITLSDGTYVIPWLKSCSHDGYYRTGITVYKPDGTSVIHYNNSYCDHVHKDNILAYGLSVTYEGKVRMWWRKKDRPDIINYTNPTYPYVVWLTSEYYAEQPIVAEYEYYGDVAGFGNALEDRPDIKIPCPPVPAENWPDNWIDELEKELNRVGNPTIDDETMIEEWEEEWDWYIDEDGNIYKQPKGTPPRKDEDIKLIPPFKPYIPENPPDRITEREIESPEITEVPHPTKPDTTIRTTTRTIERTTTRTDIETGKTTKTIETIIRTTIEEVTYVRDGVPLPEPDVELIEETETQTKPPKTEVTTDDTTINWEPLMVLPEKLTWKFPFSLPWDLLRAFQNFEKYTEWNAKIPIKFKVLHIDIDMELDLTPYSHIANMCKKIMILVLDISLILATRRLLGGAA